LHSVEGRQGASDGRKQYFQEEGRGAMREIVVAADGPNAMSGWVELRKTGPGGRNYLKKNGPGAR